jgi:hypothetical protein
VLGGWVSERRNRWAGKRGEVAVKDPCLQRVQGKWTLIRGFRHIMLHDITWH